ncbi:lipocalin family protein [Gammaproteobacteria bacterium AB-CW1]|uniref:Outer membrane lipoprotein Blc n=2 Tax=Natronospiraceae TaxID=3151664 RepID=A0AAP6MNF8_9GAMM|nr:lipocalin family protein [Gammaproteobacteria bacterium AB-CW1]
MKNSALLFAALWLLTACSSNPPMETVDEVDIDRFMGRWYVIAHIPTWPEREAYNAIEHYELDDRGRVQTTFTFRRGGFDGPEREYNPTGIIRSDNGAEWGMQFIWPIKGEFLVIYLDDDYETTIIGRTRRDYVWIMSRNPAMDEQHYKDLKAFIASRGYDPDDLRRVPQRWESSLSPAANVSSQSPTWD